jgi:DNA-binding MurR/RpiR family transcriptional regulator
MESIIHKIRFSLDEMGPAERRIADFLLSRAGEFPGMSISEFARACGCGDATVVRFSRRLGLSGYQELKLGIVAELSASSTISQEIDSTDSCYAIFQKRIADIADSLHNTETVLDEQQLDRAARAIMSADRIVIFGLGNSAAIAQDAAHKFLRLGLAAQSCCDNHMQAIVASHLGRGSVAIGVSHSGASRDIVEALRLCKICGATTVCITNYGTAPITEASDICLFTKSRETEYSILAMSSRIAQLAIFDSIYTYIVLHADKASRQAIYNTEYALRNKKY